MSVGRTQNEESELRHRIDELQQRVAELEKALSEANHRYRSFMDDLVDNTNVGFFILDAQFQIVWLNQAMERYFGLRREDVIGRGKRQLIRERIRHVFEDPDGFSDKVMATYDNNTYMENFECHVLANGEREERWLEYQSQPIGAGLYAGGRIEHYYDITDRKRIEAVRVGQQHILELISYGNTSLPDIFEAIIRFTEEQCDGVRATILYLNGNVLQHGAAPSMPPEYIELIDGIEIGPRCGSCGTAAYRKERVIVADVATDSLWEDYRHLGREFGFSACWSEPIFDTSGQVLGTFALYRQKPGGPTDTEIELIETMASVASIAIERKRMEEEKAALERQVNHSQKLESLGVLAGGIAHDFNNLLMAVLGNADLALDKLSPLSPARRNIEEIEKASKRASELANQMVVYSGKGHFVIEPINAGELLDEMAHLLKVSISKKAALKYDLAKNLPTFNGDPTQIRQIIMNLITNASEAIGDRSGVIRLTTGVMKCDRAFFEETNEILYAGFDDPLPEGRYVYFQVADTGCGMDAETIEKIFDPFFTTKFTGRGLGMSAVLGIVRSHRGAIMVCSEVGTGTTFKVIFRANELLDRPLPAERKDQIEGSDWRARGTILIVDDEETVRAVGRGMLERIGFGVATAADGHEALKVLNAHGEEIVCVLLDLTMPHLDGEEAFSEIRRLHPGIKVILCSGYNQPDTLERLEGRGLDGFIQKPYKMGTLKAKLREVLGQGGER